MFIVKGPFSRTDSADARLNRTNVHKYEVLTDLTIDEYQCSGLFSDDKGIYFGYQHPTNPNASVIGITATERDGCAAPNYVWDVEVRYGTNLDSSAYSAPGVPPPGGPAAPSVATQQQGLAPELRSEDPIERLADCRMSGSAVQIPIQKDREGKAWANTLGDLLETPLTRQVGAKKYIVSVNRLYCANSHDAFEGYVNDRPVIIPVFGKLRAKDTLKLNYLEMERIREKRITYFRHNYHIEEGPYWSFNGEEYLGWVREVANTGRRFNYYIGGVLTPIDYYPDTGQRLTDPVFMDSDGSRVDTSVPGWEDNIYFFRRYPDYLCNMAALWS